MNMYPALRARMGTWNYYIVKMTMRELANEVMFASEVYEERTLDLAIQRVLNESRSKKDIATYLSRTNDRFFSSIVVAALEGSPRFYPVEITSDPRFEIFRDQRLDESFGVLTFNGGQKYYALDGQHRLKAIKTLLDNAEQLSIQAPSGFAQEEVSVIMLVKPESVDLSTFLQSYRRLFSSLNRYAKPTNTATNIIMDEDDAFAILTRRLIADHPFFRYAGLPDESPRVNTESKNLKSGQAHFTSLETLYNLNVQLLKTPTRAQRGWGPSDAEREDESTFKRFRPSEEHIEALYSELVLYWDALLEALPELAGDPTRNRAHSIDDYESVDAEGTTDNLLFWPIGQILLARLARRLLNRANDPDVPAKTEATELLRPLRAIEWRLHFPPWRYFLLVQTHDSKKNTWTWKMRDESRKEALSTAESIILWRLGHLPMEPADVHRLQDEWAILLAPARSVQEVQHMWEQVEGMGISAT